MVPTRPGPKNLCIDHVRNPGCRMPVACVSRLKRPSQIVCGQAVVDVWIRSDVNVIKINEPEMERREVEGNCSNCENQTNRKFATAIILSHRVSLTNSEVMGRPFACVIGLPFAIFTRR